MIQTAKKILAHAIKLTKGEAGLLIYDKTTCDIAEAFRTAASELDLSLTMRKIELTGRHGLDPDAETVEMIRNHNVIICPTYYSLTHCAALTEARARGARGATLPGITNSLFMHSFADAAQILRDGTTASNAITGHHEIEVTTDAGTAVTFTVGRSRVEFDTGVLSEPGQIGNIPFGEAYTSPDLGTMEGIIAVDGSIGSFDDWTPENATACDCIIHMKKGRAVRFSGTRAKALEKALEAAGDSAFNAAEFGIGTNAEMKISGNLLGDEKLKGSIHIAFGNNKSFGGENLSTVHIDVSILAPTVKIDGKTVIFKGFWIF